MFNLKSFFRIKSNKVNSKDNIISRVPTFKTTLPTKQINLGLWLAEFKVGSQYSRFDADVKRYNKALVEARNMQY